MSGRLISRMLSLRVRIAPAEKWGPLFSIRNGVWFRLDTTVLILGVLAAFLVSVLELNLVWNLAATMILVLAVALPSTRKLTLSSSRTETGSEEPPST